MIDVCSMIIFIYFLCFAGDVDASTLKKSPSTQSLNPANKNSTGSKKSAQASATSSKKASSLLKQETVGKERIPEISEKISKEQKVKAARRKIADQIKIAAPQQVAINNAKKMTDPLIEPYVKELHNSCPQVPKDILLSATMQIIDIKNATNKNTVPYVGAVASNAATAVTAWLKGDSSKPIDILAPNKVSPADIKASSNMHWQEISIPTQVPLANVYKSLQVVNEIYQNIASKNTKPMAENEVSYVQALQKKYPHVKREILLDYVRKSLDNPKNRQYEQKKERYRDESGSFQTRDINDLTKPIAFEITKELKLPIDVLGENIVLAKLSPLQELYMTIRTLETMNAKYFIDPQFPAQKRTITLSLGKDIIIPDPIEKAQAMAKLKVQAMENAEAKAELKFQATVDDVWKKSYPIELILAQLERVAVQNVQKDIAEKIIAIEKQYALDLLDPKLKFKAVANLIVALENINLEESDHLTRQSIDKYVNIIKNLEPRIITIQNSIEKLVKKSNDLDASKKTSLNDSIDFLKNMELKAVDLHDSSQRIPFNLEEAKSALTKETGVDVSNIITTKEEFHIFSRKLIEGLNAEKPLHKVGAKMKRGAQQVYELQVGGAGTILVASVETIPAGRLALMNSIESVFKTLKFDDHKLSERFTGVIDTILATSTVALIGLLGVTAKYLSPDEKKKAQKDLFQAVIDDVISVIADTTGATDEVVATGNVTNIAKSAALNNFMSYLIPTDPYYDNKKSQEPGAYTKNIDQFRENLIQQQLEAIRNKKSQPVAKKPDVSANRSSNRYASLNMAE